VSTERIFISCTLALVIASTSGSVSRVLRLTTTLPLAGSLTSSAVVRPRMRMASDATTVPASIMARTLMPPLVPQSSLVMMQSCATSTRRRVRYPEFAVFKAVSARPLRAPWVELKYSSTDRPSLKFEMIGLSMISPEGFAIRPRMPAS
jgi:hypothetical protein